MKILKSNRTFCHGIGRLITRTAFLILIMQVFGCCNNNTVLKPVPAPLTRDQAIGVYNDNAMGMTDFSTRINEWEIQFSEDEQTKHHFNEKGGKLFYRTLRAGEKYPQFYLNASGGPLGQEALVVASDQEEFWMYSRPAKWTYRDTHENAAMMDPQNMFIMNPQFILEFLGLQPIPMEILRWPYPIYEVEPEKNIISYAIPGESGHRKIIIDRRSNLPEQINFYDQFGLRILESRLGNYQILGESMLPGDILITSPNDDSFFRLQLTNYKIKDNISDRLFMVPDDFDSISDKN